MVRSDGCSFPPFTARRLLTVLAVIAASACTDPVTPEMVTHYDLERVGGAPLPVTLESGFVLESGALSFDPDGTCLRSEQSVNPDDPAQIRIAMARCTWVQDGSQVRMEWRNGGSASAAELEGDLLYLQRPCDCGRETYRAKRP